MKCAVTHPSYYEPDLNPTYRDLGEHYGVAIIPARPYQARAKGKVVVCEWEDGRLEIRYRGQKLSWKEIAERPQRAEADQPRKVAIPYGGTPPTASHPWKQRYDGMPEQSLAKHQIRGSAIPLAAPCATP